MNQPLRETAPAECGILKATGSRKNLLYEEFYGYIADLLQMKEVQALKDFRHHKISTRFQHSLNVSYYHYKLCRWFRLDVSSAARAGLLHDLYFYDTKSYRRQDHKLRHSKYHPMAALENASRLVPVNAKEQDMIIKHMWPMTLQRPQYAETYLLTLVDKYCAVIEILLPQPGWLWRWMKHRFALCTES